MSIELYTWGTPNGRKISIALEELDVPYIVHAVDLSKGEQFEPEFARISPYNKIPVIINADGPTGSPVTVFESGAILIYLAENLGALLSTEPLQRLQTLEWLMWQMGGFGPMLGQAHHFRRFAKETVPYAIDRYSNEAHRLYKVLDARLAEHEYLADGYSIADIAVFPWAARHEWHGVDLSTYPHVHRWYGQIATRPAVRKGMAVPFLN